MLDRLLDRALGLLLRQGLILPLLVHYLFNFLSLLGVFDIFFFLGRDRLFIILISFRVIRLISLILILCSLVLLLITTSVFVILIDETSVDPLLGDLHLGDLLAGLLGVRLPPRITLRIAARA